MSCLQFPFILCLTLKPQSEKGAQSKVLQLYKCLVQLTTIPLVATGLNILMKEHTCWQSDQKLAGFCLGLDVPMCTELSGPCMTLPSSPKCLLSILSMEDHYPTVSREQQEFQVNPDKPEWNWASSRDNVYGLFHTRRPHKEGQSLCFQRKQCQGKVSLVGLHRLAQHGPSLRGMSPSLSAYHCCLQRAGRLRGYWAALQDS